MLKQINNIYIGQLDVELIHALLKNHIATAGVLDKEKKRVIKFINKLENGGKAR